MTVKDLTAGLLPRIEDVEKAIEANTRERKRLFTLRKLVTDGDTDEVRPSGEAPTSTAIGDVSPPPFPKKRPEKDSDR